MMGVNWSSNLKFPVFSRPIFSSTNSKKYFIVLLKPTYRNRNFNIIYFVKKHLFIYTCTEKKCYWIKGISFQKHVYHGFKSICYIISNIFIGSCSIFLWINSIHAFGKKCFWFNSIFLSVPNLFSITDWSDKY